MSNLSSLDKALLPLAIEIETMKRGGSTEEQKPHKLILLLAVLDLFDQNLLQENRVFFNENLLRSFEKYFRVYANEDDWCQPGPPFFHLRNSSFWKHKIKPGREINYSKIKTSGGGAKRIIDNIEYAYFDESTFIILSSPKYRNELRNFIIEILSARTMNRIPTLFHESFSLSRSSLLQILRAVHAAPSGIEFANKGKREKYFTEQTHLGPNYIKSMPTYCKGSGLLNFEYHLTTFGKSVVVNDHLLDRVGTLWLIHYFLSAPHGPGPKFWNDVVSNLFYTGNNYSTDDLIEHIGNFVWRTENRILAKRGVQSTATIFLGTYTKPEGLGKLHLLEETNSGRYRVCTPSLHPAWAIGYALLDFWKAHYPGRIGVGLDTLQESGFLKLFLISKADFNESLKLLQEAGYIEVRRNIPPAQVFLLHEDQEGLLNRLYGKD